jgi:hypothetical protein
MNDAPNETKDTRIGKLNFESGYPSDDAVQKLYDEMDFQRACQAYLWGIPAVGLNEWQKAQRRRAARCSPTSTSTKSLGF